jgi:cellulose synthase/poly-beta-1,6-N-acetylglucosamine synthase-like glycosyltransferase
VGCVSGNLVLDGHTGAGFYWKYENWIRQAEARFRGMVGVTGPIYAVRRTDVAELPVDTILDDMWIPMRLRLRGRLLLLVPEAMAYDNAFDDEREFSRKARTLAGNYQLYARLPELLNPFANPSWFETLSHKLLRLVCPWALLALFALTIIALAGEEGRQSRVAWALWCLFAAKAAVLTAAALGSRGGRVGMVARSFAVLNGAAIVGLWRFVGGKQRITW